MFKDNSLYTTSSWSHRICLFFKEWLLLYFGDNIVFLTPYSTTLGSKYRLESIFSGIRRGEINEELVTLPTSETGAVVKIVSPRSKDFQPFTQPILNKDFPDMNSSFVLDGRSYLRVKEDTALKSDVFNHNLRYGKLSYLWSLDERYRRMMSSSMDYHIKVFGGWLSGELGRRLALDPVTLVTLRLCLTIHFVQMGDDRLSRDSSKDTQLSIVTMASRKIPGSTPLAAYQNLLNENVPYLDSLDSTVNWIREILDTPTISQLNTGLIYALVNGSTFPSLKDTLAIGLEYPPAFISLVYAGLTERGANKTALGRFLLGSRDRNSESHFIRTVDNLMKTDTLG